jgi:hypothetical protein
MDDEDEDEERLTVERVTTITFEPEDWHDRRKVMVNAFRDLGFTVYTPDRSEIYIDRKFMVEVSYNAMDALKRHGIKCDKGYSWYNRIHWRTREEIREHFKMDVEDLNISEGSITIKTLNMDPLVHQDMVRKLYLPLKKVCACIVYRCESSVMRSSC